jgi:hypothetical protein
VQPHQQTNPNSTLRDNYSATGNVNPYTGAVGITEVLIRGVMAKSSKKKPTYKPPARPPHRLKHAKKAKTAKNRFP